MDGNLKKEICKELSQKISIKDILHDTVALMGLVTKLITHVVTGESCRETLTPTRLSRVKTIYSGVKKWNEDVLVNGTQGILHIWGKVSISASYGDLENEVIKFDPFLKEIIKLRIIIESGKDSV